MPPTPPSAQLLLLFRVDPSKSPCTPPSSLDSLVRAGNASRGEGELSLIAANAASYRFRSSFLCARVFLTFCQRLNRSPPPPSPPTSFDGHEFHNTVCLPRHLEPQAWRIRISVVNPLSDYGVTGKRSGAGHSNIAA